MKKEGGRGGRGSGGVDDDDKRCREERAEVIADSMFGSSTTHEHKPFRKRQKLNEDEDMISNLPEVLIRHFFLPNHQPWIPSIFQIGHNNNKYDVSLLNSWISNALNRNLKNLTINSQMELPFSSLTTLSLVDSKLLEELVLNMHIFAAIKVPTNYVSLGCLKSLKLVGIRFNLDYKYSKDLTFDFPVLQNFEVVNCTWLHAIRVTFKVPLLESFFMKQEAESASYKPSSCPIYVSASHLKRFRYCAYGFISQCITLVDPLSAHNAFADITLWKCEKDTQTGLHAFLLLKQLNQVKYIKFEGSEVLPPSTGPKFPSFGMLKHLELGLVAGEILLGILLKSPILKTLILKGLKSKFDKELFSSADVPECLQNTLEVVKFGEVHGLEHELWLAKFVMENGLVLKRMSFSVPSWLGNFNAIEEFKEKLFSFKKPFSFAFVEFSSLRVRG
ncbi:hypothetical protein Ahy_B08g091984 [Arachis hypogaea]|uniref:FBD domain-containing protein n=2 Tax=Arachis hypogaea TaxID=3818 RepID=A0A444Y2V1_ARAHY|nr:hypothetical protein Ahy_B08g091984 [Arachis hypogaea]